jgi:hypothetical protein
MVKIFGDSGKNCKFAHKQNQFSMIQDLKSPKRIIETHPELQSLGWTYRTLGVFLSSGLVKGIKGDYGNSSLISESSVMRLYEFVSKEN